MVDQVVQPLLDLRDIRALRAASWVTPPDLVADPPWPGQTLNALAHPKFWNDGPWLQTLNEIDPGNLQLHRKAFEYAQTAVGLKALGAIDPTAQVLGIGAGHDLLLYWLANRVSRVVATDLYAGNDLQWAGAEADPLMLTDPSRFARTPYRREALEVQSMDARHLRFDDGVFDVAYSLSSIEHFGGSEDVQQAMREIHRVIRPGGIACIATELVLNGVGQPETFTFDQLEQDILRSTGLRLVQPIDFDISLYDFLSPVRLDRGEGTRLPHLIVRYHRSIFTSIILFFRKPN